MDASANNAPLADSTARISTSPPEPVLDQLPAIVQTLSESSAGTSPTVVLNVKPFFWACERSSAAIPYGSLVKSVTKRYLHASISFAAAGSANGKIPANARNTSVSGFGRADGGEALTSKRRPRPDRIEIDVYAPVFAGFGKSAKLLANDGQIVVSVGIVGIEQHRLA